MKIVIDDKIPFIQGVFEPYAEVEYVNGAAISANHVHNADALIVRTRTQCNAQLLLNSKVKFIASATIGYDHIDADFCKKNNIEWLNAAGCNSGAVLQYVAAALLEMSTRKNISLAGKTIGIVGVGNVGKRIVQLATALGMNVLQCDPPRARAEGNAQFVSLSEIAQQSDFISIHVPLTQNGIDKTYHLINHDFFAQAKQGVFFINSSRGEVVDESALKHFMHTKKFGGVALDVWENEPDIDLELLQIVDIGTPHIAGYSTEGKTTATQMVVRAVAQYFDLPLKKWERDAAENAANTCLEVDCKNKSVQEILHALVQETYCISCDDKLLRNTPTQSEDIRSAYHYRREFSAYKVALKNATDEQKLMAGKIFTLPQE